jgi:CRISPR-associated endonuclease/helicase Cas3
VESYFQYWGKAKKDLLAEGPDYHLLPYHCLDVAAVGFLLLDPKKPFCQKLATQLKVDPEWLQAWFCFCLILHDLGKFCRAFQNLVPNLSSLLVSFDARYIYDKRHDSLGFSLWINILSKRLDKLIPIECSRILEHWLEVVCGHHGKPPENIRVIKSYLLEQDELAAEEFVADVVSQWSPDFTPLQEMDKKAFMRVSWQLAGLAVLADWLGSNQDVFQYCIEPMPLKRYWDRNALPKAAKAIDLARIDNKSVNPYISIQQQFDFIENPTPLQVYAQTVELGNSAQLFILEDVTGAGKTEAAMVLVHRLMTAGLANGLYVGLPTMATANAMYKRMAESYRRLYSEHELPSLVLAHGASQLSQAFNESVALSKQVNDKNYDSDELSASAYCNHWLADSRKKALLADIGVGTIDQVLLGVLPARHQSLRLLGLTNKVLLVDEVHAFDPYMRSLLSALLQAHAAQGGSAILLSATLPYRFRGELTKAFAQGASLPAPVLDEKASYPWVSQLSGEQFQETPVATRKSVERHVLVQRLNDEGDAFTLIQRAVEQGKCVCWIRNTVKDARKAYQYLQGRAWVVPDKLTLFHSRYAMIDRQTVEADVLRRFGKTSKADERKGQVLIATQVVEQSLDLDFDVMISDLAPIDLLIQRAGRLQRHTRTAQGERLLGDHVQDQREPPCLWILSPDPLKVATSEWLRCMLSGTQAVYPNVGQLWLTARVLLKNNGFAMPQDARTLIEGVYGDEAQNEIPKELKAASKAAEGKLRADAGMGNFNQLKLDKGYTQASAAHNGGWSEEVNIPTRLGDDMVTCVLVTEVDGGWVAYAGDVPHKWALSQLSLPKGEWEQAKHMIPKGLVESLELLKEREVSLRWVEIFPLVGDADSIYDLKDGWCYEKSGSKC